MKHKQSNNVQKQPKNNGMKWVSRWKPRNNTATQEVEQRAKTDEKQRDEMSKRGD